MCDTLHLMNTSIFFLPPPPCGIKMPLKKRNFLLVAGNKRGNMTLSSIKCKNETIIPLIRKSASWVCYSPHTLRSSHSICFNPLSQFICHSIYNCFNFMSIYLWASFYISNLLGFIMSVLADQCFSFYLYSCAGNYCTVLHCMVNGRCIAHKHN